jgi:hypothetical protein
MRNCLAKRPESALDNRVLINVIAYGVCMVFAAVVLRGVNSLDLGCGIIGKFS